MSLRQPLKPRVLSVPVTVACIALATIGIRMSDPNDNFQVVRGSLGKPVAINEGLVTVAELRVGNSLIEGGQPTYATAGMFVVVRVTAAATGADKLVLGDSRLLSGNRIYLPFSEAHPDGRCARFPDNDGFRLRGEPRQDQRADRRAVAR